MLGVDELVQEKRMGLTDFLFYRFQESGELRISDSAGLCFSEKFVPSRRKVRRGLQEFCEINVGLNTIGLDLVVSSIKLR